MKYDADTIRHLSEKNLDDARTKLKDIQVCCGRQPEIPGLHGWVFEQTIQYCLLQELSEEGLVPETKEQVPLCGRARADLKLNHILVEIKTSGLFGMSDVQKYRMYRKWAESPKQGFRYLFLTDDETYGPYKTGIIDAVGQENVFFLEQPEDWKRFVVTVAKELRTKGLTSA
jgi:hypothetical protein